MSRSIHDLSIAIASLVAVIDRAVGTLQAEAEIKQSAAKLNCLADRLKAALVSGSADAAGDTCVAAASAPAANSSARGSARWSATESDQVRTTPKQVLAGALHTSENGRDFIQAFEGKFLEAYDDGTSVLVIGYGHTTEAGPPEVEPELVITDEECDDIFARDLASAENSVVRCITRPMAQHEFDALVSFEFNTGALSKSQISREINAGYIRAAMATLLRYDRAGGRQVNELKRRRQAERLMFLGDVGQAMFVAGAHMVAPGAPMPRKVDAATAPPTRQGAIMKLSR